MAATTTAVQNRFFDYLFDAQRGYLCLCVLGSDTKVGFKQYFFEWPIQKAEITAFIKRHEHRHNVWFCTSLLDKKERKKEYCLPGKLVWADLDTADPEDIEPEPSIVIQSSPGRYQSLWRLDSEVPPEVAEDYSRRIAYKYSTDGVDRSGYDLTQLLRVPLTRNYKYEKAPEVLLIRADDELISPDIFEAIELEEYKPDPAVDVTMPTLDELPDPEHVIYKYQGKLARTPFKDLYFVEPEHGADWSKMMYHFLSICMEADMSREEAFALGMTAACNKYVRDKRPPTYLWREVLKVDTAQRHMVLITGEVDLIKMPELVPYDAGEECFIDEYKVWGKEATDAPEQYHELCAAIVLSACLGSSIRLHTSAASHTPLLWGLVLGESTLTRKSTSMGMAMSLIQDVDKDMLLASDGSAEGLLTGLATRPGKTSIFFKDEVSGFFESINRRDYLAGMPEMLTLLYDCPPLFTRRLRKETIVISNPALIFFGGGIKSRVYDSITEQYVLSGFLPRFLVVTGEASLDKIRPTGPPSPSVSAKREQLRDRLRVMNDLYNQQVKVKVGSQFITQDAIFEAELDAGAWELYNEMQMKLYKAAQDSALEELALPSFDRLAVSTLKLAVLLAAHDGRTKAKKIQVRKIHLINSARYTQRWGEYTVDLIRNAGRSVSEKILDKVLHTIKMNPNCSRSFLMTRHHLYSRDADMIFKTLEDRGLVEIHRHQKTQRFTPN